MAGTAANDFKGVFFIILSELLLGLVNTIVKYVHDWSTQKMMLIRNTVDMCLCLTMCAVLGIGVPDRKIALLLSLRGAVYITFVYFLWASLHSCLPLGDVVTLVVTFSPLFLVILTRVFLGEKIPSSWPLQFMLCGLGAAFINKPLAPARSCPLEYIGLPLTAAFAGALMNLASRNVKTVPPPVVCVYNDLAAIVYAVSSSAINSTDGSILPDYIDGSLCLLLIAGIIGWIGLLSNVKGYQSVSVAAVAGIAAYVSVPLGYTIQVLVFGEMLDTWSAAGAGLIVCTNVTVIISKHLAAKKEAEQQKQLNYKLLQDEAIDETAQGA